MQCKKREKQWEWSVSVPGKFTHIISYTKRLALPLNIRKSEEIQILSCLVFSRKQMNHFKKLKLFYGNYLFFDSLYFFPKQLGNDLEEGFWNCYRVVIGTHPLLCFLSFGTRVRFLLGYIEFSVVSKVICGLSSLVLPFPPLPGFIL